MESTIKTRWATGLVRFASVLFAALAVLLSTDPAEAQDCGSWPRPVLCTAELVATDSDRQSVRLSERSRFEIAPRERFDLELIGRDQRGRRFPPDRLVLGHDSYGCGGMISVDDRGEGMLRISARAAEGSCTLEIWVPNNLNFFWEIDIEISPAARTGYSRSESEFIVSALYKAILARDVDVGAPSLSATVAEVQAGHLDSLVAAIFRSAEFRQSATGVDPATLLEQFYQGILGRESDSGGVRTYQGEMRRGQYASVLLKLIRSPEFERRLQR